MATNVENCNLNLRLTVITRPVMLSFFVLPQIRFARVSSFLSQCITAVIGELFKWEEVISGSESHLKNRFQK